MSFNFHFSMSLSFGLGQPGPDAPNQRRVADPNQANPAMSRASSVAPSSPNPSPSDQLPNILVTPPTRAPLLTTPEEPKRVRCMLNEHAGTTKSSSSTDDGNIVDTATAKARDRESLEVLLRSSHLRSQKSKVTVKSRERASASSASPDELIISGSTLADPFGPIVTPIHSRSSGSDLASSLQSLRVQAMANYFQDMDSAAASMASSGSPSSIIQTRGVQEVSSAEELSQNNVEGKETTASVSMSPPSQPSPASSSMYQSVEGDVPGEATRVNEIEGEAAAEKVRGTCDENVEGSVSSDDDWEKVTAEDTSE